MPAISEPPKVRMESIVGLWFVVMNGGASGRCFPFDRANLMLVGSSRSCEIHLTDEGVEKRHAQIFFHDGGPAMMDMSGQRLSVNGKRRRHAKLKVGDELRVGSVSIRVEDDAGDKSARSRVRILNGPREGAEVILEQKVLLGRVASADLVVPDKRASRNHCAIERQGSRYVVVDMSSNGTLLNGNRLLRKVYHRLEPNDKLTISKTHIQFLVGDVAPAEKKPAPPPIELEWDLETCFDAGDATQRIKRPAAKAEPPLGTRPPWEASSMRWRSRRSCSSSTCPPRPASS